MSQQSNDQIQTLKLSIVFTPDIMPQGRLEDSAGNFVEAMHIDATLAILQPRGLCPAYLRVRTRTLSSGQVLSEILGFEVDGEAIERFERGVPPAEVVKSPSVERLSDRVYSEMSSMVEQSPNFVRPSAAKMLLDEAFLREDWNTVQMAAKILENQ